MEASIRPLARGWLQGLSPFGAKTLQLLGGHPLDTPLGASRGPFIMDTRWDHGTGAHPTHPIPGVEGPQKGCSMTLILTV